MKNVVIIILSMLVLGLGGYLVYDKVIDKKIENPTIENNDNVQDNNDKNAVNNGEVSNKPIQLKNYDVNIIKNIEVRVPVKNSTDPETRNVTITDKEQIKSILINVDDVKDVGKVPEGIDFMFNVEITVNYDGDPSTNIIILDNGNVAINKAVGVGETSYVEYEISNKNLAVELTNKYQN